MKLDLQLIVVVLIAPTKFQHVLAEALDYGGCEACGTALQMH